MRNKEYPISFQTVDIALVNLYRQQILLGKRKGKEEWRFPGGFVDSEKDKSLEEAAFREMNEEINFNKTLSTGPVSYKFSTQIDDPRYRDSKDKIMTALFFVNFIGGSPQAGDDLNDVAWFAFHEFSNDNYKFFVAKEHWILIEQMKNKNILLK